MCGSPERCPFLLPLLFFFFLLVVFGSGLCILWGVNKI
jgi:hypothetical protein